MPYQPKTAKKTDARPARPSKEDPQEDNHEPEQPKPEPSWEGKLCKECFPEGWPEGHYSGGCGHGYFERKQP